MEENYVLVEFKTTLNNVISQSFQTAQRIKLTSFDVSNNYIIFGASSGGIYIFKRDPCEFLKLIPSKDGSATKIQISPNEKNLAIGSSKGLVIILENFFVDVNLHYQVYTEHENNVLTCLKWHNNDLYCGDNTGKISVISLMNILSKAIFQSPSAALMHLDSSVVQLDIYKNFLLISTLTRTYLCNTEKEQYRQIGKKVRDGPFGACFYNIPNSADVTDQYHSFSGIFKVIKDDETFSEVLNNENIKIYCARPGARLWEVNFEPTVVVTHQFRHSFAQHPSKLLVIDSTPDCRLEIINYDSTLNVPETFNFRKIYPILNRFILTFDNNGIYIFDPLLSRLVFWNNSFRNIKDIVISNSLIYVWENNLKIHVFSLVTLEELIMKCLLEKQYYLCADLCASNIDDVLQLVETSKSIYLISILKTKLLELKSTDLHDKISIIFDKIEENNNKNNVKIKIVNGIVVIDNIYSSQGDYLPEPVKMFEKTSKLENPSPPEINPDVNILLKQYKLNKTHKNVEITDLTNLYKNSNINDLLELFEKFLYYIKESLDEDARYWTYDQYLKQASKMTEFSLLTKKSWTFLEEAFIKINESPEMMCSCKFPLPIAHCKEPKYFSLSKILLNNTINSDVYIRSVPYLHKIKLENLSSTEIGSNLILLLQFSDTEIIKEFSNKFTYDMWDESIKYIIKLKQNKCLNCGSDIDTRNMFSWSTLGSLMIASIGAQNTTKLFKRYSKFIKNGELDKTFFQLCIFSKVINLPKQSLNLVTNINNAESNIPSLQFESLLTNYLEKQYVRNGSEERHVVNENGFVTNSKCTYCDLPLNTPVINKNCKLSCGHTFHSVCFCLLNNVCNQCVL